MFVPKAKALVSQLVGVVSVGTHPIISGVM